jgi:hypothetical protein
VKRSPTNGGPYAVIASGVSATNYLDSGLAGGTTYYYVVSAIVSGSETTNSAQATATTVSPVVDGLAHRYSFSENGGSTWADSVGGPVWNGALPNGGTLSGGQLTLSSGSLQYGALPPGIVGSLSNLTLMAWVNLASVSDWTRIFDFGNDTTTNLYLMARNGFTHTVRFGITTNGSEEQINCDSTLTTGVVHQVTVTLSGATGVLYLDGVAVGTNSSMTLKPMDLGNPVNNYLGKSQYSVPTLNGSLDELRIYNTALSADEIAATAALGSSQLLSAASPPVNITATPTDLTLTWPLASAGYTVQSCTNLTTGDWENVPSPAPQIISGQWQVTLPQPADAGSTLYRLVKQP